MGNYMFGQKELPSPIDGLIEGHNLMQATPHTPIYVGISGLTFRRCNLTNCDLPVDAITVECLLTHSSFCSHLHELWLEKGFISECGLECTHMTSKDVITIDGVVVNTSYSYADKEVT